MATDYSLRMEYFVLNAFKYALKKSYGIDLELKRRNDPAHIADADFLKLRGGDNYRIGRAKFAIGYAMEILITDIVDNLNNELSEQEYEYLISFEDKVINAKNYEELSEVFKEFYDNVLNEYYNINDGNYEQNMIFR